jgi:hypothetical protein
MEASLKLNTDLPYDPAIPLLGIYPKQCKSGYYKGTFHVLTASFGSDIKVLNSLLVDTTIG